jgi:hypothetical protein
VNTVTLGTRWHSAPGRGSGSAPQKDRRTTRTAEFGRKGISIASGAGMLAQEMFDELAPNDRPTIPVPAPLESGVRLKVERVSYAAATVDVVLCDLSRDPRSESYPSTPASKLRNDLQNERPPSTSTVRALK